MLSARYTGGTNCDINSDKPRETVVYYSKKNSLHPLFTHLSPLVCNEQSADNILSFQEVSSCYYEMTVITSRLCSIPAFR